MFQPSATHGHGKLYERLKPMIFRAKFDCMQPSLRADPDDELCTIKSIFNLKLALSANCS
jgi:hypothetical protein